jgi:hypothetical protein
MLVQFNSVEIGRQKEFVLEKLQSRPLHIDSAVVPQLKQQKITTHRWTNYLFAEVSVIEYLDNCVGDRAQCKAWTNCRPKIHVNTVELNCHVLLDISQKVVYSVGHLLPQHVLVPICRLNGYRNIRTVDWVAAKLLVYLILEASKVKIYSLNSKITYDSECSGEYKNRRSS